MQTKPASFSEASDGTSEASAATPDGLPLVHELTPCPNVFETFELLTALPNPLLLESARRGARVARFSFATADPFRFLEIESAKFGTEPFQAIRSAMKNTNTQTIEGLPPFQGGAAGLASYELGRCWERLPTPTHDEFQMPALAVGLYDWVIAWDHEAERAWVISQGLPETDRDKRHRRAHERLRYVLGLIQDGHPIRSLGASRASDRNRQPLPVAKLSPQFAAGQLDGLTSNFSRDDYLRAVARVIEYIHAGDVFQANLSQRLLFPANQTPLELYSRLRQCNSAPFAGFFSHDDWTVISASPERFVSVREGEVETRPIKGTRRRRHAPEADLFTRDELRESEKDQAENVMIVDLLRNDLSRICQPSSIRVPRLCSVETYETVQHLVSEIRGQLRVGSDCWDLLQSVFPGGSITGAPKIRAMEIINELEQTARGPYCGSLFYAGFDGQMDSNILIRTFTCRRGWIQCPVGGGIVAQSNPLDEYNETMHKAEGMLRAL